MRYLALVFIRAPEVLAMHNPSREPFVVLGNALDVGYPRNVVVTSRNHNGIESLLPPLILSWKLFPQSENPLIVFLLRKLDCGTELQQLLVPISHKYVFNPVPDLTSTPERSIVAVLLSDAISQRLGERLRGEAHDLGCDVGMQMLMLGCV